MENIEPLLDMGFLSREFGVSDETRHVLANEEFTEIVSFDQDTILIQQASQPDALYFTLDGVFHAISHANPGAPYRLLGRIEPGQFIGEVCLVDRESKASATVKAMRHAMALKMKPNSFELLSETHPKAALEFLFAVSRQLASRLRAANEKVL
ncbi:MAG: Crp/Fnr family transcriptional regulator [Opitutales bacterium]